MDSAPRIQTSRLLVWCILEKGTCMDLLATYVSHSFYKIQQT